MTAENIVSLPGRDTQGIEVGTINGGSGERFVLQSASGVFVAGVAFSCLVKPMSGDRVMFMRDPGGDCYILAILERPLQKDALLSFPGDVTVETGKGRVCIAASEGIDMVTGSTVNMFSAELSISAAKGRLNIADVEATGDKFTGSINKVELFSDAILLVAKRMTQSLRNSIRRIEQVEFVKAGQLLQSARNLFSVRARQSAIIAKDDAKIDGKRVHIG